MHTKGRIEPFCKEIQAEEEVEVRFFNQKNNHDYFLFSLKNKKLSAFLVVDAFKYSKQYFIEIKRFRNKTLSE